MSVQVEIMPDAAQPVSAQMIQALLAGAFSGSVFAVVLKGLIDNASAERARTREWKEKALSLFVGPLVIHLRRTKSLSDLYQLTHNVASKSYFHACLVRQSNLIARDILLSNGHLMSRRLLSPVEQLLMHYDVWLAEFDMKTALENPGPKAYFDMGFVNPGFPELAKVAFEEEYDNLRMELYGSRVDAPLPCKRLKPWNQRLMRMSRQ